MKRLLQWSLGLALLLVLLSMLGAAFVWHELTALPGFSLNIDGEEVVLHGAALPWGALLLGLGLSALLLFVVLPLVLLMGLGLPLLIVGGLLGMALLVLLSLGALLCSPLLLLALLAWWLLRVRKPEAGYKHPSGAA